MLDMYMYIQSLNLNVKTLYTILALDIARDIECLLQMTCPETPPNVSSLFANPIATRTNATLCIRLISPSTLLWQLRPPEIIARLLIILPLHLPPLGLILLQPALEHGIPLLRLIQLHQIHLIGIATTL
jgi:hypothetical protein